jgi:hypothetical protein
MFMNQNLVKTQHCAQIDTAETPIKKENKTSDGNEEATLKESFSAKL